MKNIYIVGSGFKGLKIASVLSCFKQYKIFLFSNSEDFIFTPYIVSMIYKRNLFSTNLRKFCKERSIKFFNQEIIEISKNFIKSEKSFYKIDGIVLDCRNNICSLLDTKKKSTYNNIKNEINDLIFSDKKYVIKGHNIQALEIALALNYLKKLDFIYSNKNIFENKYISNLKTINHNNLKFKFNNKKLNQKDSKNKFELITNPSSAQEASQEAKFFILKILKWIPTKSKKSYFKRGTMIKTGKNISEIFLFNSKKTFIHGFLADIIRNFYYFIQFNFFYKEKRNIIFLKIYLINLRVSALWEYYINSDNNF